MKELKLLSSRLFVFSLLLLIAAAAPVSVFSHKCFVCLFPFLSLRFTFFLHSRTNAVVLDLRHTVFTSTTVETKPSTSSLFVFCKPDRPGLKLARYTGLITVGSVDIKEVANYF